MSPVGGSRLLSKRDRRDQWTCDSSRDRAIHQGGRPGPHGAGGDGPTTRGGWIVNNRVANLGCQIGKLGPKSLRLHAQKKRVVGPGGLKPPTSRLWTACRDPWQAFSHSTRANRARR